MKKAVKSLITIIMTVALVFVLTISVSAQTEFEFDSDPHCIWTNYITEGEEYTGFLDRVAEGNKFYSNNEDVMYVRDDGILVAKSEGTVAIAEVKEGRLLFYYGFIVRAEETYEDDDDGFLIGGFADDDDDWDDDEEEVNPMVIIGPILIVLVVLLVLAEIGYIFVTAPKYGMSRFWALAPIVGNVFGLIVFLMLKTASKQNNQVSKNVIICPTCNGKHPCGTQVCSICGTKLEN